MLSSINKLFGRSDAKPNPTAAWPIAGKQELVYDLRTRSLNGLALDGAFTGAKPFGRCEDFEFNDEYLDLFYLKGGFVLEFASDELMGIVLVVSGKSYKAKEKKLGTCTPVLINLEGKRQTLTQATTLQDLSLCFGPPVASDPGGEDSIHSFILNKNFVDAFLDSKTGKLLHLEICKTNEA